MKTCAVQDGFSTYMINSHKLPLVPEHHNLLLRLPRPLFFPLVDPHLLGCRRVLRGHVEHFTPRSEVVVALSLLGQGAVVGGIDGGEAGYRPGVEPCCAAAGGAGEGVEHLGLGKGVGGEGTFGGLVLSIGVG